MNVRYFKRDEMQPWGTGCDSVGEGRQKDKGASRAREESGKVLECPDAFVARRCGHLQQKYSIAFEVISMAVLGDSDRQLSL